jgi:hypothetical protein
MITKIVEIAVHWKFKKIYGTFLKFSSEKFTEMRYSILACMWRFSLYLLYLLTNIKNMMTPTNK